MIEIIALVTLFIFLGFSVCLNIFLIWYGLRVLKNLIFISDDMNSLLDAVAGFRGHIKSVYELEIFYGDETLGSLLGHAAAMTEVLEDFEDIYKLTSATEEEDIDEDVFDTQEEDIDGREEENTTTKNPSIIPRKAIFHQGP